jgi:hypothetical protein
MGMSGRIPPKPAKLPALELLEAFRKLRTSHAQLLPRIQALGAAASRKRAPLIARGAQMIPFRATYVQKAVRGSRPLWRA